MNGLKKIYLVLIISTLYIPCSYTQQQVHIPWPSLADSPWPVGRGDAQATGRSKYIGPTTPDVIWRKDMPLGIFYGPVIGYNDDLFVGTYSYNALVNENYFYSINNKGENNWTFITEGSYANVAGSTVAGDGTIYFISGRAINGTTGGLFALNPDGTFKWRNEKFISSFTRFIPISLDNNLYMYGPDSLFILEPENGTIINSFYIPYATATEVVFSAGGDTIYYISGRYQTQDPKTINAATKNGDHLWSLQFSGHNLGVPVVDNTNRIYLYGREGTNRYLYCINPDGTVNWKYHLNPLIFEDESSPTIDSEGNIIFLASTGWPSDSGVIISVDYNGNLNWKTALGHYQQDGGYLNHGLVCDAEGKIYCGSSMYGNTHFWCLDSDGTILWKLELEGYRFHSSAAIGSDGTLYIGTHHSFLVQNNERNLIAVNDKGLSVDDKEQEITFQLYQNYPNPFNPITLIDFMLMQRTNVTLKVFNILGQEIRTLVNEEKIPGYYSVIFDGKDPDKPGQVLPSGVYFYELVTDKTRITKKMILLR